MWYTTFLITAIKSVDMNDEGHHDYIASFILYLYQWLLVCILYLLSFSGDEAGILIAAIVVSLYLNWIRICLLFYQGGHLPQPPVRHHPHHHHRNDHHQKWSLKKYKILIDQNRCATPYQSFSAFKHAGHKNKYQVQDIWYCYWSLRLYLCFIHSISTVYW